MKKSIIAIISIFLITLSSCTRDNDWGERGEICTSVNKRSVEIGEKIIVTNCGDIPPLEYVTTELDWGDGTITSGISGEHTYNEAGNFTIIILLNSENASEVIDVDETKVKHEIEVK